MRSINYFRREYSPLLIDAFLTNLGHPEYHISNSDSLFNTVMDTKANQFKLFTSNDFVPLTLAPVSTSVETYVSVTTVPVDDIASSQSVHQNSEDISILAPEQLQQPQASLDSERAVVDTSAICAEVDEHNVCKSDSFANKRFEDMSPEEQDAVFEQEAILTDQRNRSFMSAMDSDSSVCDIHNTSESSTFASASDVQEDTSVALHRAELPTEVDKKQESADDPLAVALAPFNETCEAVRAQIADFVACQRKLGRFDTDEKGLENLFMIAINNRHCSLNKRMELIHDLTGCRLTLRSQVETEPDLNARTQEIRSLSAPVHEDFADKSAVLDTQNTQDTQDNQDTVAPVSCWFLFSSFRSFAVTCMAGLSLTTADQSAELLAPDTDKAPLCNAILPCVQSAPVPVFAFELKNLFCASKSFALCATEIFEPQTDNLLSLPVPLSLEGSLCVPQAVSTPTDTIFVLNAEYNISDIQGEVIDVTFVDDSDPVAPLVALPTLTATPLLALPQSSPTEALVSMIKDDLGQQSATLPRATLDIPLSPTFALVEIEIPVGVPRPEIIFESPAPNQPRTSIQVRGSPSTSAPNAPQSRKPCRYRPNCPSRTPKVFRSTKIPGQGLPLALPIIGEVLFPCPSGCA